MTQELYLIDPELTHAKLHIQLMVSHLLKHDLEMLFMFFCTLRVHKDVVNEHHNKLVQLFHEHRVHECCRPKPTDRRRQATRESGGPEPLSIDPATRTRPEVEVRWVCHLTYT
jgi:hypothetical protein